jgi:glycosyltransferase involved in cell wall biosynthesis
MNAIDCLVHPQVGTEAFGLVLLEAFACGRPVISSALDGLPEAFAVGNHGQLVAPDSVDDLAHAMVRWANEPVLDEKGRAALWERLARDYSLPAAAQRVIALYASLMNITVNS